MGHAFMKAKFLNYQKRNKISQVKQWELYKKQVAEIIQEAFESYRKDEELH
jgi:FMN-dependent NADH-azoreductase